MRRRKAPVLSIREMCPEDYPQVQAIADGLPEWFDSHARTVAIPIDIRHQRGLVAVSEGRVIGFATLYVAEGRLNIGWLAVARAQQRHGIGRALLARASEIAARLGIEELATWTLGDGVDYPPYEPTRRFYFANGFVIYQRDKTDNPGCPEAIRLSREIELPPSPSRNAATDR